MKDLAIILAVPLEDASDLSCCKDYPSMQSYQIFKHTKDIASVSVVGTPYGWISENGPDKTKALIEICQRQGIDLDDHRNLLICGVNSLKKFDKISLSRLSSMISGSVYQIDDSNFNEGKEFVTLAHYIKKSKPSNHSIDLGLAVADDIFLKGHKTLSGTFVIHVDHRWTKTQRLDGFSEIRSLIADIKSAIENSERWNSVQVIYHTEDVVDIDSLGTYDPPDVDILALSEIYAKCHLAMVSHAETLGQYPLEMLCSGASVVMNRKFIPKETRGLYDFYEFNSFDPEKFLKDVNEISINLNRSKVLKFGYKVWVEKMINSIIK